MNFRINETRENRVSGPSIGVVCSENSFCKTSMSFMFGVFLKSISHCNWTVHNMLSVHCLDGSIG
jgi:hypothetical protein